MWVEFNPNRLGHRVGDCAVRAVCAALDIDWDRAYWDIAEKGYVLADMPSSNAVWGAVLRDHGFNRSAIPDKCPVCYSAADFAIDHPKGIYVLGFGGHVATVKDGMIYDAWDSSQEIPQYVWYKNRRYYT